MFIMCVCMDHIHKQKTHIQTHIWLTKHKKWTRFCVFTLLHNASCSTYVCMTWLQRTSLEYNNTCINMNMCVCMYIYIHTSVRMRIHICTSVNIYTQIFKYTYTYIHVYICTYTRVYVCTHKNMSLHTDTHTYKNA